MNATHTPGPWRVGDAGATVFGPPNGEPAPLVIATVKPARGGYRANARLIAEAPAMLRELETASTRYQNLIEYLRGTADAGDNYAQALLDQVEAADEDVRSLLARIDGTTP